MADQFVYPMNPGEVAHERVGRLSDGRQVLVTSRFGPIDRDDGEHEVICVVIFDALGAVISSHARTLEAPNDQAAGSAPVAIQAELAGLPAFEPGPIAIQAVPTRLLGESFAPMTLPCDEAPELSVMLPGGEGFFIPTWPFGRES